MIHGENSVPWKFLTWDKFTKVHKQGLAKYLLGMDPKKRPAYIKYLEYFCGAPVGALEDYIKTRGG